MSQGNPLGPVFQALVSILFCVMMAAAIWGLWRFLVLMDKVGRNLDKIMAWVDHGPSDLLEQTPAQVRREARLGRLAYESANIAQAWQEERELRTAGEYDDDEGFSAWTDEDEAEYQAGNGRVEQTVEPENYTRKRTMLDRVAPQHDPQEGGVAP